MINLAQRDIFHTAGKFIVTAIGVGMLLGVVLIMIGVYRGMLIDGVVLLNDTDADIWVVQKDTLGPFAENSRVHEDIKNRIRSVPGIEESAALAFQNIQIQTSPDKKPVRVFTVGYEAKKMGGPKRIVAGREIMLDHFELVADEKIGLGLGDEVTLGGDSYRVVGITRGAVSSGGDPLVYMSLKDAQKLQFLYNNERIRNDRARGVTGQNIQQVNAIVAKTLPGADIEKIAEYIKKWKHYGVHTNEKEEEILTKNLIERASKQIGMFTAILIIVSSVIISLIIYTMTLGKIKEISILKLIGISNGTIVRMIMQESVILGFLAFIAGNFFSHAIADNFPKRVVLESGDAVILFAIVIAVSIAGSISGVYSALKADPTAAIGG